MSKPVEISNTHLSHFDIKKWKGKSVHQFVERINSFLNLRKKERVEFVLAFPKIISTKNVRNKKVKWLAIDAFGEIKTFKLLDEQTQSFLLAELNELKTYIFTLLKSEDRNENGWGVLLNTCLENISTADLHFDGRKLFISEWGLRGAKTGEKYPLKGIEEMKLSTDEKISNLSDNDSNNDKTKEEVEDNHKIHEEPDDNVEGESALNTQSSLSNRKENNQFDNDYNRQVESDLPSSGGNSYHEQPITKDKEQIDGRSNSNENKTSNEKNEINEPIDEKESSHSGKEQNDSHQKSSFPPALRLGCSRYFWWLVLIPILLLIFLLCKECSISGEPITNLPDAPFIITPIDTMKITPDKDSVRMIVSDRLNVLIRSKEKTINDFVTSFNGHFDSNTHKIIYYDTLTKRIQLQIPPIQLDTLKHSIKDSLPDFDLLIWHESIFSNKKEPADPDFGHKERDWYFKAIKVQSVWEKSFGSKDIVIAVIDDGFDLRHKEFTDNFVFPWNVVERSNDVFTNKKAIHGSHVAGIAIAKRDNNAGLAGIAPDCRLMPIQVADRNGIISSTAVVDAILYAIHQKADVINLSLGLKFNFFARFISKELQEKMLVSAFLDEAVFWNEIFSLAEEKNISVVIAAGNDNVLAGIDPMQRNTIAIKVSAVDRSSQKANFSNHGKYSTISAPGVGIFSSVPNIRLWTK